MGSRARQGCRDTKGGFDELGAEGSLRVQTMDGWMSLFIVRKGQ